MATLVCILVLSAYTCNSHRMCILCVNFNVFLHNTIGDDTLLQSKANSAKILDMESKPLIGVVVPLTESKDGIFTRPTYLNAITEAGGIPVLIFPGISEILLPHIDAFLLIGGPDVDARRYNQTPHGTADQPDMERDQLEGDILQFATEQNVPVWGICRGMQRRVVWEYERRVAAKQSVPSESLLVQDIPRERQDIAETTDDSTGEMHGKGNPNYADLGTRRNNVHISPDSRAKEIWGEKIEEVNCMHHQMVNSAVVEQIGLHITGTTPKGVPEILEAPEGVYVQFHPESQYNESAGERFFKAFITTARERRAALTSKDKNEKSTQ